MTVIPWPPSVNQYYRHLSKGKLAGRTLISEKGRAYRAAVADVRFPEYGIAGPVSVDIRLYPPDRRRRDIDNVLKALFDAMTHAGVWLDDSQVKRLQIEMMPATGGHAEVVVIPYCSAVVTR